MESLRKKVEKDTCKPSSGYKGFERSYRHSAGEGSYQIPKEIKRCGNKYGMLKKGAIYLGVYGKAQ